MKIRALILAALIGSILPVYGGVSLRLLKHVPGGHNESSRSRTSRATKGGWIKFDQWMARARANHLKVLVVARGSPAWANG